MTGMAHHTSYLPCRTGRLSAAVKAGFTLIELSIVLVIIGLIAGGVLVGQDLIHAAQIRASISQIEKYNAAVNTFRTKFNCLPGDCPNATDFGFDAVSNGNGDGIIGLCTTSPTCTWSAPTADANSKETVNFWYHLSAAGLISDTIASASSGGGTAGTDTPKTKILPRASSIGGWTIQADAPFDATLGGGQFPAHSFVTGGAFAQASLGDFGDYSPADIYAIDAKMDDGLPLTGTVRAFVFLTTNYLGTGGYTFNTLSGSGVGAGGANSANCISNDVTPSQYNVLYNGKSTAGLCDAVIKAAF